MKEFLLNCIEKLWLKKKSIPVVFVLVVVLFFVLASSIDGWSWIDAPTWVYIALAIGLLGASVVYSIVCICCDHLPKAPKESLAVLFCVDAESDQLYEMAKFKLVDQFNQFATANGKPAILALCVSKMQIAKYSMEDKDSMLSLLGKTNCVLFVYVRYTADDIGNAENFELQINCGVSHPICGERAEKILMQDLRMMKGSVGKQRFKKEDSIDVFNLTAQTLTYACQYILGFVHLLAGNNETALRLLKLAKTNVASGDMDAGKAKKMQTLIDDRIFSTLCQIAHDFQSAFQRNGNLEALEQMNGVLEMANAIRPETYFYNINMAFVQIALSKNAAGAKECVAKCKLSREDKDWMYSDAFLSAYCGHAPTTIIRKYLNAFKVPYTSLVEIVDYIEFVIDAEPEKKALHLAAGLVYEAMGEIKLVKQHLSTYLTYGTGINQKTRDLLTAKMLVGDCGENCSQDCVRCVS